MRSSRPLHLFVVAGVMVLVVPFATPAHARDDLEALGGDTHSQPSALNLSLEPTSTPRIDLAAPIAFETTVTGESIIRWFGSYDPATRAAVEGEAWTFDHGAGDPLEGRTSTDEGENDVVAWRWIDEDLWAAHWGHDYYAPVYDGIGSVWLGLFEDDTYVLCWPGFSGGGYGNRWVQRLETLPLPYDNASGDDVGLSYRYFCDLEEYCDYLRVILVVDGSRVDTVATYTGIIGHGGYQDFLGEELSVDLFSHCGESGTFSFIFEMTSDGGYSDEDGDYLTEYGAAGLDNILITEFIPGHAFRFDFETPPGLDLCTASTPPGAGTFLAVNPSSEYALSDISCGIEDNVLSFHNESDMHPEFQMEEAISPPIPVSGSGVGPYNIFVDMDVYQELYSNDGVAWQVKWAYYPYVDCLGRTVWSVADDLWWNADISVTCWDYRKFGTSRGTGTAQVPAGADSVRLHLAVLNDCPDANWGDCSLPTNFTPLFDNIRVGITNSTVWHVPGPGSSNIQAGIDSTANGDTVLVRAGTRTGEGNRGLEFKGKEILVCSEEGPERTIIDCEGADRGFWFGTGETQSSILDGLTVINGVVQDGDGGGMYCTSSPWIRNCFFVENGDPSMWGGGAYLGTGAPVFEDCVFAGNEAHVGGGLDIGGGAAPTFEDCLIVGNWADGGPGAAEVNNATAYFLGCTISRNETVSGSAVGFYVAGSSSSNLTMERCILYGDCDIAMAEARTGSNGTIDFLCSNVDTSRCFGAITYDGNTISVDPDFCVPADCGDVPTSIGEYTLPSDSPCLPAASPCGELIGALGAGWCGPAGAEETVGRVQELHLGGSNPNPFGTRSRIDYALPGTDRARVLLRVFDPTGRLVRVLVDEDRPPGIHSTSWDGRNQRGLLTGNGVYFYELLWQGESQTRPVVLIR